MPVVPPTLMLFGSQASLPSAEILADLRQVLIGNPKLDSLRKAIRDLPRTWQVLTEMDPDLSSLPGNEHLNDLNYWIEDGRFTYPLINLPSLYALPINVLIQIALYVRYFHIGDGAEQQLRVLEGLNSGGIQGLCVGFLTASAIACSDSEEEIAKFGAVALRLAVCIGAYVDRDGAFADQPTRIACMAVSWSHGAIEKEKVYAHIKSSPSVSKRDMLLNISDNPIEGIHLVYQRWRMRLGHWKGRRYRRAKYGFPSQGYQGENASCRGPFPSPFALRGCRKVEPPLYQYEGTAVSCNRKSPCTVAIHSRWADYYQRSSA